MAAALYICEDVDNHMLWTLMDWEYYCSMAGEGSGRRCMWSNWPVC
jgi:hypothetical protein